MIHICMAGGATARAAAIAQDARYGIVERNLHQALVERRHDLVGGAGVINENDGEHEINFLWCLGRNILLT